MTIVQQQQTICEFPVRKISAVGFVERQLHQMMPFQNDIKSTIEIVTLITLSGTLRESNGVV